MKQAHNHKCMIRGQTQKWSPCDEQWLIQAVEDIDDDIVVGGDIHDRARELLVDCNHLKQDTKRVITGKTPITGLDREAYAARRVGYRRSERINECLSKRGWVVLYTQVGIGLNHPPKGIHV